MKKSRFFIIIPVLFGIAAVIQAMLNNPHEFPATDCILCHQVGASNQILGTGENITPLCESCHPNLFSEGYMHPVDIQPIDVSVPADLPLTSDGYLTCNTCHDVHSSPETPFGTKSYFLRRYESGVAFCSSCHGQGLTDLGHQAALGEAHFTSDYIATDPFADCDPMSINCISCHDGSVGVSVPVNTGVWIHQQTYLGDSHDQGGHPICFDYNTAQMKPGRKTDLRPSPMIDSRIQFFDGKMGCGTCHNPYHLEYKHLVLQNQESQLCFACHLVDE
jgi:predicted CXXCH cytochrome family protein